MNRDLSETKTCLTRRGALATMVAAASASAMAVESTRRQNRLGLVIYNCSLRRKWVQQTSGGDLFAPLAFLKHCQSIGAGGMQANLGVLDAAGVKLLRDFASEHALAIDGIVNPPKDHADLTRFEAEIQTAAEVGVQAVRTVVMPGRRYEQFKSLAEVRDAEAKALATLQLAAPIVTKHQVRLAVENHKDQRIDERVSLYKQLKCEFIGATVDTGNSFALLDDPYGAIEALAPYAFTVHLKDQALRATSEGFLLGDIPLGQGAFDLKRMVEILRRANPGIHMMLELITRDALHVPCLTESYWATMPNVPGADLARTLRLVKQENQVVQQVSSLKLKEQVELEDANIAASLRFAREELSL